MTTPKRTRPTATLTPTKEATTVLDTIADRGGILRFRACEKILLAYSPKHPPEQANFRESQWKVQPRVSRLTTSQKARLAAGGRPPTTQTSKRPPAP
jgi:hypothetical protein